MVVLTSTNSNTRGMHEQTTKLLTDSILPAVKGAKPAAAMVPSAAPAPTP
jgi:hypothetical protein